MSALGRDIAGEVIGHWDSGEHFHVAVAAVDAAIAPLVESLQWYSDISNWNTDWGDVNSATSDRGQRARAILARAGDA